MTALCVKLALPTAALEQADRKSLSRLPAWMQAYGPVSPATAISPTHPIANAHTLDAQLTLVAALVQFRENCNDFLFANIAPPVSTQTGGQEN